MNALNQAPNIGRRSFLEHYQSVAGLALPVVSLILLLVLAFGGTQTQSRPVAVARPAAPDLATNPELKVLVYPADKAAVQIVRVPEPAVLSFPEAMDPGADLHANPELKVLSYPTDKADVQVVSSPEAAVLRFPEAMDPSADLHANPELKVLQRTAAAGSEAADLHANPELKFLQRTAGTGSEAADLHANPELKYLNKK